MPPLSVVRVLQETLAAYAAGLDGPAPTTPLLLVPSSCVEMLADNAAAAA